MRETGRIAVLGTNWIGDAVMSLAALRELRRLNPEAELVLIVRDWVAELYSGQNLVDRLIPIPTRASRSRQQLETARALEGCDLAILFRNSFASALPTVLAGVPRRLGYASDGRGWLLTGRGRPRIRQLRRHQVYYYLDLLYQTGLSPLDYLREEAFAPDTGLATPSQAVEQAEQLLDRSGGGRRPRVILNPGAFYGPAKRWYPERFATLADRLKENRQAEIVLVGSARERDMAEYIRSHTDGHPILLTGQTSLLELIGLLATADLLITNDSGPMHLAAALNTPQIALFGSTDERATGPLSSVSEVIHKHVSCSPCLLRDCPIDLRCFDRITVEEVLDRAEERLS